MAWASQAQAKRMTTLVLRHANDILFMLRGAPDDYEPLLLEREVDGERVPIIDDWCTGFVIGISLDEAAWQPLLDADGEDGLLHPILLFGTEEGWQRREADPTLESRSATQRGPSASRRIGTKRMVSPGASACSSGAPAR